MIVQTQVALRSRKLGVLIRDARLAARKSIPECAQIIGVTPGSFKAWEEGRKAPSLPELEVLSYSLNLPLHRFWSKETSYNDAPLTDGMNLPAYIGIRQRLIGALLRQEREKTSISLRTLSEQTGFSTARLKAFELGEHPISLPELEGLITFLGGQIEGFFDQAGPIGLWMNQQKAIQDFLKLPPDIQKFACKPINIPYLELAMKLSSMSTDKLRSVAENLLDITF
jgi:transcriptional regulator with XRE-family HTH domain